MATISVNLNEKVLIKLIALSEETDRSRSFYVNEAITEYLEKRDKKNNNVKN